MTKAYILNTRRQIAPFDRHVGSLKIHNRSLAETQQQILADAGLSVEKIDNLDEIAEFPCVLVHDDLYFTHYALKRFLKAARQAARVDGQAKQAALGQSLLTERFVSGFQGELVESGGTPLRVYDCFYIPIRDALPSIHKNATPLLIPHRFIKQSTRVNRQFEPSGRFVVPVSLVFMTPVRHWSCLVSANMLGMPAFLARQTTSRALSAALLPWKVLCRAGSVRPSKLLGKVFFAGRRCRIHPSAHVEGCVLGYRVKVGPNAVLRNCVIGDRTHIDAGAVLDGCSIGREVTINAGVVARGCVADDGANLGTFVQLSVLGKNAVMCPSSGIADFALRGTVGVKLDGESVRSGSKLLGGCLGDDAFLGPMVALVCGRELPNGCMLLPNPRNVVRDVTNLPDNVARADRGSLRRQHRADAA